VPVAPSVPLAIVDRAYVSSNSTKGAFLTIPRSMNGWSKEELEMFADGFAVELAKFMWPECPPHEYRYAACIEEHADAADRPAEPLHCHFAVIYSGGSIQNRRLNATIAG